MEKRQIEDVREIVNKLIERFEDENFTEDEEGLSKFYWFVDSLTDDEFLLLGRGLFF